MMTVSKTLRLRNKISKWRRDTNWWYYLGARIDKVLFLIIIFALHSNSGCNATVQRSNCTKCINPATSRAWRSPNDKLNVHEGMVINDFNSISRTTVSFCDRYYGPQPIFTEIPIGVCWVLTCLSGPFFDFRHPICLVLYMYLVVLIINSLSCDFFGRNRH